ncbi:hypothetical protein [Mycobacterium sp.]|uniref:hypothetical protein n=1 Tax=Mycobacterium sp. TaxID=1785 RepID=UPI0026036564|nr:hypothetical protein [Mycobacterium sp.]
MSAALTLTGAEIRQLAALVGRGATPLLHRVIRAPDASGLLVSRADGRQWHVRPSAAGGTRPLAPPGLRGDVTGSDPAA